MAETSIVDYCGDLPAEILKWKVRQGSDVQKGSVLCTYRSENSTAISKLKAGKIGTVEKVLVEEGTLVQPGVGILVLGECTHRTVMKDLCALCGVNLRDMFGKPGERKESVSASVAMVHSVPELIVSEEEAKKIGGEDQRRLLRDRKLVLLVDLDQTLLHTTKDNVPPNLKDVHHFQMWHGRLLMWYHTKFRPGIERFLKNISKLYELHICTFGVRMYAHSIARILDPQGQYFSHRILSRDECFNPTSKTANLRALFPCGDSMVAIIDDREDVWSFSPNLIHVRPYQFFFGTADINVPPGLSDAQLDQQPKNDMTRESRIVKVPRKKSKSDKEEVSKDEGTEVETIENGSDDEKDVGMEKEGLGKEEPKGVRTDCETVDAEGPEDVVSKCKELKSCLLKDAEKKIEKCIEVSTTGEPPPDEDQAVKEQPDGDEGRGSAKEEGECDSLSDDSAKDNKKEKDDDKPDSATEEGGVEYDEVIEWIDHDDYLLYLEDVLCRIHQAFYELYDQTKDRENQELPSLKKIIPYVKRKTLQGTNILFSGLPTNRPLEQSRKYHLAQALGANVQNEFVAPDGNNGALATTHVVASRPGTQKVRSASRYKNVHVVNHDWLFACADRWERVDEQLFARINEPGPEQLRQDLVMVPRGKRKCGEDLPTIDDGVRIGKATKSPRTDPGNVCDAGPGLDTEQSEIPTVSQTSNNDEEVAPAPSTSYNQPSGLTERRFSDSYNPMLAFSKADIDDMDKEVADILESSESENEEEAEKKLREEVLSAKRRDSSSEESLGGNFPHGWKKKLHKRRSRTDKTEKQMEKCDDDDDGEVEDEEGVVESEPPDQPHRILRHSSDSDSDSDNDKESFDESIGSVDEEMAAAVEKELMDF